MDQITNHHSVIPALPGYYVLDAVHGDAGIEELVKIPIVAWAITYNYVPREEDVKFLHAQPVTYEGASHGSHAQRMAILSPDGTVDEPFFSTWDSVEAYLTHLRKADEHKRMQADDL